MNTLSKDNFNKYSKSSNFAITLPAPLDKPMQELDIIPGVTDRDDADRMILDAINLLIRRQNALVEIVAAQALKSKL